MAGHLGPLELVGDRWVIGDPTREDGLCIVFTPDGLEQRRREEAAALLAIKWSEFADVRVRAAYRRWQATRGARLLAWFQPGIDVGPNGCSLRAFLRREYELGFQG